MPLQSSVRALKKPLRLDDEVRFLRSWIEKPLHMGAVMPSGRVLARTMLEQAGGGSKELIGQALAEDEISVSMASLCGFEQGQRSKLKSWDGGVWHPAASA